MARKYEMVDKGYEYRTEGFTIKKSYVRQALTHTGFCTLDRYGWVQKWTIYPDDRTQPLRTYHTLKEAKAYINGLD